MKRFTALATTLVVAGSVLLPTAASADPWVTATSDGIDVDGTTGPTGMSLQIQGSGCSNTGGTAVMGLFVSPDGDPWLRPIEEELIQIELPVDTEGAFAWDVVIAHENGLGTFTNRWYCATEPVTAMRDGAVTWVSPPASLTIEQGTPVAGKSANRTAKAAASTPATVSITMDPDGLPAVDKVDIKGKVAARIKNEVDQQVRRDNRSDRKSKGGSHHKPNAATRASAEYVAAAFETITGRTPSAKVMKPFAARLDDGGLKVQVVEDIALTENSAAWWNRR